VQQHAAHFIAHTAASTGAELPRFIKEEFDAFLECGILAQGFLRLRCGECGHDKLVAFSCKRPQASRDRLKSLCAGTSQRQHGPGDGDVQAPSVLTPYS
jgi:hypothetical protein